MLRSIKIAAASSAITPDVRENGAHIRELMTQARAMGARLIHFPEGALSGYVKSQVRDWNAVDWVALRAELDSIAAHAGRLDLWTVLGCNHRLTPPNRPHNSLYVISATGSPVDRYDKRLCSQTELNDWYAPGVRPVVFDVEGFKFGAALCIEVHFPELFAEYERLGVDCVLFSAYSNDPMFGIQAQAHAAANSYWLSLSTPAQCSAALPSGVIGPDGQYISRRSSDERPGLACGEIDREGPRYAIALTKARPWRAAARSGEIHKPRHVDDIQSNNRTSFFVA